MLANTLFIATAFPAKPDYDDFWVMPDPDGMRKLSELLDIGSLVFAFHSFQFGNGSPTDPGREANFRWHEQFETVLDVAFGGNKPEVQVENGHDFKFHGGYALNRTTHLRLGAQTKGRLRPTPIRLFGPGYWRTNPSPDASYDLFTGIVSILGSVYGALVLDASPLHFDDNFAVWAMRSGMKSRFFKQMVVIESWDSNRNPVLGKPISLT